MYVWWVISEIIKHFFMFIVSCAGMAYNIWAGLFFFFVNIGIIAAYVYLLILAIIWIIGHKVDLLQTKKQIAWQIWRYLRTFSIPKSKYIADNRIKNTKG